EGTPMRTPALDALRPHRCSKVERENPTRPSHRTRSHRCGRAAPCARPVRWKGDGLRQVSWLAGRRRCSPSRDRSQWLVEQRLAADSCGGSSGFVMFGVKTDVQTMAVTGFPISRLVKAGTWAVAAVKLRPPVLSIAALRKFVQLTA